MDALLFAALTFLVMFAAFFVSGLMGSRRRRRDWHDVSKWAEKYKHDVF